MTDSTQKKQIEDKRNTMFLLGLLLVLGFLVTSLVSYMVSRNSIRNTLIHNELPLTSDNIYSEIHRDLSSPVFIASLMANDTFLRDWVLNGEKDVSEVEKYLTEIQKEYDTISAFFVSDKTKIYYHPSGKLKTVSDKEPRDKWYYRARNMKEVYEINVDLDMANEDAMTIFINYKVFDCQGKFIGATGVGLTVNTVKKLMNDYRTRYNRNIYFFNTSGDLVLGSSIRDSKGAVIKTIDDIPGLRRLTPQILNGNLLNFEYLDSGSTYLLNVRFIPIIKWLLVVEQVEDDVLGVLKQTLVANLFISFIISLFVLWLFRLIITRYRSRLEIRNTELIQKNEQIEEQTRQLEKVNTKLEALNKEKDEFVGITAHDLKSPLNSIIGFAELINTEDTTDKYSREYSGYILDSSRKMLDRINSLLDLREIESSFNLNLEPFDFREPLNRTLQDFKFQAQNKNINLETDIPETEMVTLANPKWMVEIVSNLVSNALKYSPKGKTVFVVLSRIEEHIRLEVRDQGPGISPEEMTKLFTKYPRLSPQPTGDEGTTGLGLFIVKKMTDRMKGRTWCESEVGTGSRFFVEFPAACV